MGLPFTIYEPQITSDGNALVFTHKIKADFPNWDVGSGSVYTAQKAADALNAATPQSIEALILYYGTDGIVLLKDNTNAAVATVIASGTYSLDTTKIDNYPAFSHYVIVPLDTERIKVELNKRVPAGSVSTTPVVWIEENDAIGTLYSPTFADPYGAGTYISKFSLGGGTLNAGGTISANSTIENFDNGIGSRSVSIATVLAKSPNKDNTSKISFYIGSEATGLLTSINTESGGSLNTGSIATWMSKNKPALRVDYKWAN